jgi:hypothetical protein
MAMMDGRTKIAKILLHEFCNRLQFNAQIKRWETAFRFAGKMMHH